MADMSGQSLLAKAISFTLSSLGIYAPEGYRAKLRDGGPRGDGALSGANVRVTAARAMQVSAFWACAKLLASSIGSLPFPLYERTGEGSRRAARGEPLYRVLHDSPNADQSPTDFWELMALGLMLDGNAYARKRFAGSRLVALDPLPSPEVSVMRRADGRLLYRWHEHGSAVESDESEVFHIRGFGGGPLKGLSPIAFARETLGLAIAADTTAAAMFANGLKPSGTLNFKDFLTEEQRSIAEDRMVAKFMGASNSGAPMVLEGGVEWKQLTMSADDAQLLESRAFSIEEICRIFGVPPFMIGHTEKSTSWGTGIEQQTLGFLKFTLNPYLRRIEQAVTRQLIAAGDRDRLYAEFNVEGLLRADSAGRVAFYRGMSQIGALTVNEIRAKENLPPIEGGDVARVQSQNVPLTEAMSAALDNQ